MTDYKTMRVPVEAWEDAKERKEQHGMTWGEWMQAASVEVDSTTLEEVDLTPVMNRIDDLGTELTKQHEDMTGGR